MVFYRACFKQQTSEANTTLRMEGTDKIGLVEELAVLVTAETEQERAIGTENLDGDRLGKEQPVNEMDRCDEEKNSQN